MMRSGRTGGAVMRQALLVAALAFAITLALGFTARAEARYDFSLEEVSTGQKLDLKLLTDGKPLIVHVWSPDCPHCQRHMPYLVGLYKKLDLDNVNFVTISMADTKGAALDYIEAKHLAFPVLHGGAGQMADALSSNGWPTSFVFAPGGKLVGTCDNPGASYVGEMLDLVDKALR